MAIPTPDGFPTVLLNNVKGATSPPRMLKIKRLTKSFLGNEEANIQKTLWSVSHQCPWPL